jgi:hypothetical protein
VTQIEHEKSVIIYFQFSFRRLPMSRLSFPPSTKSSTKLTIDGETLTLKQWAQKHEIPYDTLRMRYERGVRGSPLLTKVHLSVGHHRGVKHQVTYRGETISLRQLAKLKGLRYDTLYQRHITGVTGDDLICPERLTKTPITKELITYGGKTMTLKQWAEELNIQFGTLRARWVKGLRDAALLSPVDKS